MYFPRVPDIYSRNPTPMTSVSTRALDSYPALGLRALARTALGCGIGLMVADRFQKESTRQVTAITLVSVGVLGSMPWLVDTIVRAVNRPESERAMRRRLEGIRESGDSYEGSEELY